MNIMGNIKNLSVSSVLFVFCAICLAVLLVIGSSLPVSAQGTVLYGARYAGEDGPATLYRIDPTTGDATVIGPIGFERCGGMDFNAAGILFATAERMDGSNTTVLITINPNTGVGTEVGEIGLEIGDTFFDVSFRNSDGILFTSTFGPGDVALGIIDTETGMGTYIGDMTVSEPGNAIAFSPTDILYHCNINNGGMLYTLNQSTGEATDVTSLIFPGSFNSPTINAMDFHPESGVLFATVKDKAFAAGEQNDEAFGKGPGDPKYLVTIDTETGIVTTIGQTETDMDAIAFSSSSIPVGGEAYPVGPSSYIFVWISVAICVTTGTVLLLRKRTESS